MNPFFGGRKNPLVPSFPSPSSRLPTPPSPSPSQSAVPTVPAAGRHALVRQERHELDLLSQFQRKHESQEEEDMLELRLGVGPPESRRKTGEGLPNSRAPTAGDDSNGVSRYPRKGCSNSLCNNCDGKRHNDALVARALRCDNCGAGTGRAVASPPSPMVMANARGGLLKMYKEKRFDFGGGGGSSGSNSAATQLVPIRAADTNNIVICENIRSAVPPKVHTLKRKIDALQGEISPEVIRLVTQKPYEPPENSSKSKDPRSIWSAYKQQSDLFSSTPVRLKTDDRPKEKEDDPKEPKEKKDDPKDSTKISSTEEAENSSTVPPTIQISDDEKSDDTLDVIV